MIIFLALYNNIWLQWTVLGGHYGVWDNEGYGARQMGWGGTIASFPVSYVCLYIGLVAQKTVDHSTKRGLMKQNVVKEGEQSYIQKKLLGGNRTREDL